jgi:site-specific DNA-methyltransferase (adenine-specific)
MYCLRSTRQAAIVRARQQFSATGRMANHLYYGDNLEVLLEHIKSESVDLVYLDPPFNANATYNVLFRNASPS